MRILYQKINSYIPFWCAIVFVLTVFSAFIYLFCAIFEGFAEFINQISFPIRATISYISSFFPFSVAELFIILLPLWGGGLIFLIVKLSKSGRRGSIKFLSILSSFFCLYFIFFVWTYASGYHTKPIEEKMELDREALSDQDVYDATIILTKELNSLVDKIDFDVNGSSVMPYSYKELTIILMRKK